MSAEEKPQLQASGNPPPPRARALFRQGAVYGLAGALKAADVAKAAARGAVRGARDGVAIADRDRSDGVAIADHEPPADG